MDNHKKAFHEEVAEKLIEQLKEGTAPWQKPWSPGEPGSSLPMNPTTEKRYKGINAIRLMMEGRSDQRWMTYKQAQAEGAQVRKGEKGTSIQYWKFSEERTKKDDNGKPVIDTNGEPVKENVPLERPRVFFATVFNAEQIDGLPPMQRKEQTWNPIERAEHILATSDARIIHSAGDRAFYRPSTDSITMPERGQFETADRYYATALHELGHWTGHPSRLDRDLSNPFGSEGYAKEELRAEIASMILGDELGIGHDPKQHTAYVGSWIKSLQDDPLEIFRAAADAEKIQNFVLAFEQKQVQNQQISVTQAVEQNQEQAEVLAHIQETHQNANPGYSALESWQTLQKTAADNGYEAVLRWSNAGEHDPDVRIEYRDSSGQVLPIHTELNSGDGKAVTCLDGQRVPGTGMTSDDEWQSAAFNSAIATMQSRNQTEEADMEQGQQLLREEPSSQQLVAEQWVLKQLEGDMQPVIGRMNERQLDTAYNVLDAMHPMATDNPFWQRHETMAEAMLNAPDDFEQKIFDAKEAVERRREMLHEQVNRPALPDEDSRIAEVLKAHRNNADAPREGVTELILTHADVPLTLPMPNDWTGDIQVRGCKPDGDGGVEEAPPGKAEFFGLYAQDSQGLHFWVADADTEQQALELADRLKTIDAYAQTDEHEQAARLARLHEEQVRRDPSSTDEDISAAKESRKNAEMGLMLNDSDLQRRIAELERSEKQAQQSQAGEKPANTAKEKTWLAIPYEQKDEAKQAAGKLPNGQFALGFDKPAKCWYAKPGANLDNVKQWLPENQQRQEPAMKPRNEFAQAMKEAGLVVEGDHPIMDGKWHRVPVEGGSKGNTSGAYRGFELAPGEKGVPAGSIQNHRTGVKATWKAKGYAISESEKATFQADAAKRLEQRSIEREANQTRAVKAINELLAIAPQATANHIYLKNKQARPGDLKVVPADTSGLPADSIILIGKTAKDSKALREANPDNLVFTAGDLLLTAQDTKGDLKAVQSIRPNGTKMFAKGTEKHQNFHVVGGDLEALTKAPAIVVGEGYATADTLSQSLGYATVAAFDSGNLSHVAKQLREQFPDKPFIIAGDNDVHQEMIDGKNPGRTKALEAAKAVDGKAIFPIFAPREQSYPANLEPIDQEKARTNKLTPEQQEAINQMKRFTDFNDLATKSVLGREGLDRQVRAEVSLTIKKHQERTEQQRLEQLQTQQEQRQPRRAMSH